MPDRAAKFGMPRTCFPIDRRGEAVTAPRVAPPTLSRPLKTNCRIDDTCHVALDERSKAFMPR